MELEKLQRDKRVADRNESELLHNLQKQQKIEDQIRLRALALKDERNDNLTECNDSHKDKDMIQKEIIALKRVRRE